MIETATRSGSPVRAIVKMQSELLKVDHLLRENKQVPFGLKGDATEHFKHERAQILAAIQKMLSFKDGNVVPEDVKPLTDAAVLLNSEHNDSAKQVPAGSKAYEAYHSALRLRGIDKPTIIAGLLAVEKSLIQQKSTQQSRG